MASSFENNLDQDKKYLDIPIIDNIFPTLILLNISACISSGNEVEGNQADWDTGPVVQVGRSHAGHCF